jgi:hypothetical protein
MSNRYILVLPEELGQDVVAEYTKIIEGICNGKETGIILSADTYSSLISYKVGEVLSVALPSKLMAENATEQEKTIFTRIKEALKKSETAPWVILTLPFDFLSTELFEIKGI